VPDHEPALGQDLASSQTRWISGYALAREASLLIHDSQYTEDEYPAHRGWGHSSLPDALAFSRRCEVEQLLLFHHDPWHDDRCLEALGAEASERSADLGGEAWVQLARERMAISPHGPAGRPV
jgi:ribonuclease BN (tRNA processing enzyme)